MVAGNSSPQNIENAEQNSQASQDDLDLEPIPKKRMPRLASIFICVCTATGIIVYGFIEKSVFEYKQVRDHTTTMLEAIKNGSVIIYTKDEKETYPVLFSLGLGLVGIILGTFVDRFSLVFEELCHFKSRYNRSVVKLFKACFSGISWLAVLVIVLLAVISLSVLARKTSFKLGYLIYILGGIGVGPLVMHLLNLNAQSEVDVSRLVEERRLYPAYTIAWNYYFQHLKKALPIFNESFAESDIPVQDQGTGQGSVDETTQPKVQLSLKKLILLISHDCKTKDNLNDLDNHIRKITVISNNGYDFPVYGLTSKGKEHKYVVLYAKEALETLKEMSKHERIKAIHENNCEHQVKLLCRTLVSEILANPLDDGCSDMCIVVPIMAKNASSLQNGGLVKLIMTKVKADERGEQHPSFIKAPTPTKKTKLQQETDSSFSSKKIRPHKGRQEKGMLSILSSILCDDYFEIKWKIKSTCVKE